MANIVLGVGASHSPLLIVGRDNWEKRSDDDRANPALNTFDGRFRTYSELVAERGEPYARDADPARFPGMADQAEASLNRLSAAIAKARPDIILVVGDDQGELFGPDNQPMISIFHGDELVMKPAEHVAAAPPWARKYYGGYRMDLPHRHPGAPALAMEIILQLVEQGVDVATMDRIADPTRSGFGHAFGFVLQRLLGGRDIPMLPVILNTYFPPNTPTASRCYEIGVKIAAAIEASASDARVCVLASGGLSHFLCEEEFDRELLESFKSHNRNMFTRIPQAVLQSGTSEVRNWITVAGMMAGRAFSYEYQPVRRTPLGTGIGLGFALWS